MSNNKRKFSPLMLVLCAVLAALYVVLSSFLAIRLGNSLRITFASLPVILAASLLGPVPAAIVAAVGEFINQMISYGLSPTLPLWLLPPVCRGVMVGLMLLPMRKKGVLPETKPVQYGAVLMIAALLTTVVNTLVMWADSVFWGYYSFAYVFGTAATRFVSGIITAAAVAIVAVPVLHALRRVPAVKKLS